MLIRKFALLGVLVLSLASVAACENTVRGAGQDMQEAGNEMEHAYDGNNY